MTILKIYWILKTGIFFFFFSQTKMQGGDYIEKNIQCVFLFCV